MILKTLTNQPHTVGKKQRYYLGRRISKTGTGIFKKKPDRIKSFGLSILLMKSKENIFLYRCYCEWIKKKTDLENNNNADRKRKKITTTMKMAKWILGPDQLVAKYYPKIKAKKQPNNQTYYSETTMKQTGPSLAQELMIIIIVWNNINFN